MARLWTVIQYVFITILIILAVHRVEYDPSYITWRTLWETLSHMF